VTSLDRFLWARRTPTYNCLDFAHDVWLAETGQDLKALLGNDLAMLDGNISRVRAFSRVPEPVSPCLVLMRGRHGDPHVGVFLRGSVLHLLAKAPEYMDLSVATRGFTRVRFYR
jgi:hypothetical protein